MASEEKLNAHIHFTPEAPHRLRRREDTERRDIRLRLWQLAINLAAKQTEPFDMLQQLLDAHEQELTALAIRRLGVRAVRT